MAFMCGRFSLTLPAKSIAEFFLALNLKDVKPRYNMAPTQDVLCILRDVEQPGNLAASLRWGLVPSWAKDPKIGNRMTNARCETISEKPSFRGAFRYRRCLIPVSGFYEWLRVGKQKHPFYFVPSIEETPFAFAGLWETWTDPSGAELLTCTIITTQANAVMSPVHHRMPVILDPSSFDFWLDLDNRDTRELQSLLAPCPEDWILGYPVSNYVSRSGNEGPKCIEPTEEPPQSNGPQQLELF